MVKTVRVRVVPAVVERIFYTFSVGMTGKVYFYIAQVAIKNCIHCEYSKEVLA